MSRSFISPSTPGAGWRKSVSMSPVPAAPPPIVLTEAMLNALPPNGIEDMITLEQLSEETILANLKRRFDSKLIYVRFTSTLQNRLQNRVAQIFVVHFSLSTMHSTQALTGVG
jgi:uncharacterized membrane protein